MNYLQTIVEDFFEPYVQSKVFFVYFNIDVDEYGGVINKLHFELNYLNDSLIEHYTMSKIVDYITEILIHLLKNDYELNKIEATFFKKTFISSINLGEFKLKQ